MKGLHTLQPVRLAGHEQIPPFPLLKGPQALQPIYLYRQYERSPLPYVVHHVPLTQPKHWRLDLLALHLPDETTTLAVVIGYSQAHVSQADLCMAPHFMLLHATEARHAEEGSTSDASQRRMGPGLRPSSSYRAPPMGT